MAEKADKADKEKLDHVELVSSRDTGVLSKHDGIATKLEYSSDAESADINEGKTLRKMDLRIVPMVTILYLLSWLDRGNVGNAKVLGMQDDLNLIGNRYNLAYTVFFFPYAALEVPANLILKKIGPRIWLPLIMVIWGIITTCIGTVENYHDLLVGRIFLGVAEAGQYPGVTYYLSAWYGPQDLGFRQGIFFSAAGIAGAFSGLLGYAISKMDGVGGYEGWRWIFILEGLLTVVVGVVSFFLMSPFPEKAKFLSEAERSWVLNRVKYRGSTETNKVAETDQFKWKYVWAAFLDWQIWLAIITDMAASCTIYGMSAFLPSIVAELGYSGTQANLLTIPPYVCSCILTVFLSWLSDRLKVRSTFVICLLAGEFVGYSLALAGSARGIHGLAYAGVFISVSCCYPCFILIITWIICNLAPSYKRAAGAAVLVGIGNMSGPMGSNFYRDEDAPQYLLGHGLELMMVTLGLITATTLLICYKRINKNRERQLAEGVSLSEEELSDMGDRAPTFRYYL